MKQSLALRIVIALAVICFGAAYLIPSMYNLSVETAEQSSTPAEKPGFIKRFFPDAHINLGLDLLGGIHLTLGVEVEKAIEASLVQMGSEIASSANKAGLLMAKPRLLPGEKLEFTLTVPEKQKDLEELLAKSFSELTVSSPASLGGGNLQYVATLKSEERKKMEDKAIDLALNTIRNRIDQFGVAEPDIRRMQDDQIVVQLPGMDSTQRAIAIIGKTAHLEFRLVRNDVSPNSVPPLGVEFLPTKRGGQSDEFGSNKMAVEKQPVLTGEHITDAKAMPNTRFGGYLVTMTFDRRGQEIFARVTGENSGRNLAIVLDGQIHTAPLLKEEITTGQAEITGNFTFAEANDLAVILRSGSLPAPVKVLEERTVGPSLGQESINSGIMAALTGCGIIVVFLTIYYGLSGIIASIMLVIDIALILAGMSIFGATLTLPGIAGIVLTIGMAVDANVLIFERIREELRAGIPAKEAVALGFSLAQRAILDSNLTSIIATVILYELGTGPIRGFAVTLTMGIIASMFTAIFVSHIVFDLWMGKNGRKLSI